MTMATLIIAASEHDADMLYISGMFVPDAFIAIEIEGAWHALFSPLEIGRARKKTSFDHLYLDTPWREKAKELQWGNGINGAAAAFLKERGISEIIVPGHFPLRSAEELKAWGFHVQAKQGALFESRIIKTDQEIKHLSRAERLTKNAMRQAEKFLAESDIGSDGILLHSSFPGKIKSKHLRSVIETYLIQNGAMPAHTIVACGREGADPHSVGHGYLRAHQPIIIDIFPRVLSTGYWGDMTRTYVKGEAPEKIKKTYQTVKEGQDIGLNMIADAVAGADIHRAITKHFDSRGFKTGVVRGKQKGFFHGTGHGVGLEIHEAPRISTSDDILRAGQVITIEPGLYDPAVGGVRIEDMVVVQQNGHINLTRHPRKLEIE